MEYLGFLGFSLAMISYAMITQLDSKNKKLEERIKELEKNLK